MTLKESIQYAAQNPTSQFAQELKRRLLAGEYNKTAKEEGADISAFIQQNQEESKDVGILGSVVQNTIGSRGVSGFGGQIGKTLGLTKTVGDIKATEEMGLSSKAISDNAMTLIEHAKTIQDPIQKANLLKSASDLIKQSQKISQSQQTTLKEVEKNVPTIKDIAGTAINTALTVGAGFGATPVQAFGQGFVRSAATRAAQTGATFATAGLAQDVLDDKKVDEIVLNAAMNFGLGALGSGLFSTFITSPFKWMSSRGTTNKIFQAGLGFDKATRETKDAQMKVTEALRKYGAGTKEELLSVYTKESDKLQSGINEEIAKYMASTKKGGTYNTSDILNKISSAYRSQFTKSLSKKEIDQFVAELPLDILRRKKVVNIAEINALRQEITNKLLSPTAFKRSAQGTLQEGITRQLLTAGNVLSKIVKGTVRKTEPMFAEWSNLITGIDAALSQSASGPLNSGARIAQIGIGAGLGATVAGVPGALLGAAAEELQRTTIARTMLAEVLSKAGLAVDKLTKNEIYQFGQYLVKLGVLKGIRD
jgi:hypothetical protein